MWRKMVTGILTGIMIVGLLGGCGSHTEEQQVSQQVTTEAELPEDTVEAPVTEEPGKPYDLLTKQWQNAGKLTNSKSWWKVAEYIDNIIQPQQGEEDYTKYSDYEGADFYVVIPYSQYADEEKTEYTHTDYWLQHFDAETMEVDCVKLDIPQEAGSRVWVTGISASGGEIMVFLQVVSEEEYELQHYYGCPVNGDGTLGESVEFTSILEECGLKPEPRWSYANVKWDNQGYFYLRNNDATKIYVADSTGSLIDTLECEDGQILDYKMRSPEGLLIWEKEDMDTDTITYFCYGEKGMQILHQGQHEFVTQRCMNEYGEIIYVNQTALVRWKASDGTYERLYVGTGMENNSYRAILQNSQGEIVVLIEDEGRISASSYSLEGPAKTVELNLLVRGVYDYTIRSYINEFVRKHPGVTIKVQEQDRDNKDAEWTQLLAELAAGNGPDLIMLNREELLILKEKGVLADLSEVLPKELEEQIFTGVLDNGRVDGKLYGMTYQAYYNTLMVSKELWQEDTWTVEDVLETIEELEAQGTPIEAFHNTWFQSGGQTGEGILNTMLYDLENSPFLDLEKGECYFDTEEFCRLLEVCKRYGAENVKSVNSIELGEDAEQRKYVKEGKALAYTGSTMRCELAEFSADMAGFDNTYRCVGYPTEGESGNFWSCGYAMAVNAKAQDREVIDELLQYFYSEECQMNSLTNDGIIVRKDLLINSVVEHVDWSDVPVQNLGGHTWADLQPKPDGSTYLEEYLELLDSCAAPPSGAEEVETILSEEVDAFFTGDKDAETVAEIIQRRVQLYLDERK